jgi:hypothetical protein
VDVDSLCVTLRNCVDVKVWHETDPDSAVAIWKTGMHDHSWFAGQMHASLSHAISRTRLLFVLLEVG